MKNLIILLFLSISGFSLNAQEDYKSSLRLDSLEYEYFIGIMEEPPYLTQVTKYPLTGLGSSSVRTKMEVHKYVYDNDSTKYLMQFVQNSYATYDASYLDYNGIIQLVEGIDILKKDLEAIGGVEKDFDSNFIARGKEFKVGYFFAKGKPKWYVVIGRTPIRRTMIEGTFWLEDSFREAKEKIESLMEQDAVK